MNIIAKIRHSLKSTTSNSILNRCERLLAIRSVCFNAPYYSEQCRIQLVNLFSDLGGNIGLWIGFSLITVLEVIELIFEIMTYTGKFLDIKYAD